MTFFVLLLWELSKTVATLGHSIRGNMNLCSWTIGTYI